MATSANVIEALLDQIDKSGGRLAGGPAVLALLAVGERKGLALKKVVDHNGGLKKFCALHPQLEFVTEMGSDGFIRRAAAARARATKSAAAIRAMATESAVAQLLLALVDELGGKLDASQAPSVLRSKGDDWKKVIDDAGGLKNFCLRQRDVEFVTEASNRTLIKRALPIAAPVPPAVVNLSQLLTLTPPTSSGASSASGASSVSDDSDDDSAASAGPNTLPRQSSNASRCNLGNTRTMYHATTFSNAKSIIHSGEFRPGKGGLYGPGIYFCEDPETAKHRSRNPGATVLEFQVQLGRLQPCKRRQPKQRTKDTLLTAGHHSIQEKGKGSDCYMIPHNGLAQIDMTTIRVWK